MGKLEDQFVAGSWAPPFMTPPKKKTKVKQKKQQTKEKTQKENKPNKAKEKNKQTYCTCYTDNTDEHLYFTTQNINGNQLSLQSYCVKSSTNHHSTHNIQSHHLAFSLSVVAPLPPLLVTRTSRPVMNTVKPTLLSC